jgi:excisionase family DNA binding protein
MTKKQEAALAVATLLLKPDDLAEYLGVPVKTLYEWRSRGGGPPGIRIGRHLRYRMSDVQTWLNERTSATA